MHACRTWQGSPVYLSDVQLLVPQPEYDFVRGTAQSSGSFVVQLAGGRLCYQAILVVSISHTKLLALSLMLYHDLWQHMAAIRCLTATDVLALEALALTEVLGCSALQTLLALPSMAYPLLAMQ